MSGDNWLMSLVRRSLGLPVGSTACCAAVSACVCAPVPQASAEAGGDATQAVQDAGAAGATPPACCSGSRPQ